jgi:hypothetical protein
MKTRGKCKLIIVLILPPAKIPTRAMAVETKSALLRLPRQEQRLWQVCFKESYALHFYLASSFMQESWDGDAET